MYAVPMYLMSIVPSGLLGKVKTSHLHGCSKWHAHGSERHQAIQENHGHALGPSVCEGQWPLLGCSGSSSHRGTQEQGAHDARLLAEKELLHLAGGQRVEKVHGLSLGSLMLTDSHRLAPAEDIGDELLRLESAQVAILEALTCSRRCSSSRAAACSSLQLSAAFTRDE